MRKLQVLLNPITDQPNDRVLLLLLLLFMQHKLVRVSGVLLAEKGLEKRATVPHSTTMNTANCELLSLIFIANMLHRFMMASSEGPRMLWEQLKGKKVKTNDGHDVGEIKEITQYFILLEKGIVNKDKSWIPKYLADAYDGKVLWLVISNDELAKGYSYKTEPDREQYTHDFEAFKATPYGQRAVQLPDFEQNIRMTEERKSDTSINSANEYKNIRDLE